MYKTIDYRKQAITPTEAKQYKMEGKIIVVKMRIATQEYTDFTEKIMRIQAELRCNLFMNSKWHREISAQLEKYEMFDWDSCEMKETDACVYLRGEIYYNHYEYWLEQKNPCNPFETLDFLFIKPTYGIQFIVGDNERYF